MQACVRRWLAKCWYQKTRWQMARSVVTLQRHVRGWITRKKIKEKQKMIAREIERERERQRALLIEAEEKKQMKSAHSKSI